MTTATRTLYHIRLSHRRGLQVDYYTVRETPKCWVRVSNGARVRKARIGTVRHRSAVWYSCWTFDVGVGLTKIGQRLATEQRSMAEMKAAVDGLLE